MYAKRKENKGKKRSSPFTKWRLVSFTELFREESAQQRKKNLFSKKTEKSRFCKPCWWDGPPAKGNRLMEQQRAIGWRVIKYGRPKGSLDRRGSNLSARGRALSQPRTIIGKQRPYFLLRVSSKIWKSIRTEIQRRISIKVWTASVARLAAKFLSPKIGTYS